MAPAQALPGVREETSSKSNANLMCSNNCEDNQFYAEPSCEQRKAGDEAEYVNVLECDDGGTSDSMSSFGDTVSRSSGDSSDTDDDSCRVVESVDSLLFDGPNGVFKKKKVTEHWRKFIRPIMWRCQWLELRMKELKAQAMRYDKELESYKHEKQLMTDVVDLDNSASRSVPLDRSRKKDTMRRQKRKKNEDLVDAASYMSNHNVFSYENTGQETDIQSVDDNCDDLDEKAIENLERSVLRFRRRDTSLEQILLEIDSTQSRVIKLMSCLNEITSRHALDSFPRELPASCAQSPSFSPENNGYAVQAGAQNTPTHHLSEYEMTGSAVSSYGDVADLDMLESTMGLLSSVDIPVDQQDDVLIDNQATEDRLQNFYKVSHAIERPRSMAKEEARFFEDASAAPRVPKLEPNPGNEAMDMQQALVLKPCYTGKKRGRKPKKRRRGGFAGGSGGGRSQKGKKRRLG